MKNRIKNIEGRSTSSEEAPEYFGAKGALLLKNENIMCDTMKKYFCSSLILRQISWSVGINRKDLLSRITCFKMSKSLLNHFNN